MADLALARRKMVDSQIRTNKVTDPRVIEAFETVPREAFLAPEMQAVCYIDEDVPIGEGRYLIEPMVFARMLQALAVGPGDVALDIGCGTGYSSAVLARLAATVVALEQDPALAARANENLTALSVDNAVVVEAPLEQGYAAQAPFDVIFIGGAVSEVPDAIARQLSDGGRLSAVVRDGAGGPGKAVLGVCRAGRVSFRPLFDASIPMLPGFARKPGFVF